MNKSKSHPKRAGRKSSGLYRRPFQLAARTVEELNRINRISPLRRTEILLAAIAAQKKDESK